MYTPPKLSTVEKLNSSAEPGQTKEEAAEAYILKLREEDAASRAALQKRLKDDAARTAEAKRNRVYVAMGPIFGAVLLANLVAGAVGALLYALFTAR